MEITRRGRLLHVVSGCVPLQSCTPANLFDLDPPLTFATAWAVVKGVRVTEDPDRVSGFRWGWDSSGFWEPLMRPVAPAGSLWPANGSDCSACIHKPAACV